MQELLLPKMDQLAVMLSSTATPQPTQPNPLHAPILIIYYMHICSSGDLDFVGDSRSRL